MAGSRTLKLSILADVDDLKKKLAEGERDVEGFSGKLDKFSSIAKAAFIAAAAAAAAYASKLAIEGVKAAIEDEAAQQRLALALKNVTGATDAQIAAIETQILKTSLATGVADDQLRPALQRLATSTGDVQKSQDLLNLALDIASAKNISVETAANALAKAYDGNTGSLAKLGVGLSAAEIKTLGFEGTVTKLSETFAGAAATQAETFQGKIARLQVAFDEAKESVGNALLPILESLLTFFTEKAIPAFANFKKTAIDPVIQAFKDNKDSIKAIYDFGTTFLVPFITVTLSGAIKGLSTVAGVIVSAVSTALKALEPIINAAIAGINAVIRAKNLLSSGPDTPTIPKLSFSGNTVQPNTVPNSSLPQGVIANPKPSTVTGNRLIASDTNVSSAMTVPSVISTTIPFGNAIPSNFDVAKVRMGEQKGDVIINVNSPSIIDREGFSRAVVDALNESADRGTGGGGGLYAL